MRKLITAKWRSYILQWIEWLSAIEKRQPQARSTLNELRHALYWIDKVYYNLLSDEEQEQIASKLFVDNLKLS